MRSRERKTTLLIGVSAVVLLPLIHVLTYARPFLFAITQILTMALTAFWMMQAESRVLSAKTRRQLLLAGGYLLLFVFMLMVKQHCYASRGTVVRYFWYASYIPMTAVPLHVFLTARSLDERSRDDRQKLLRIPEMLLIFGFLTNDLHRRAFDFPHGIERGELDCTLGILYWCFLAWTVLLFAGAFFMLLKHCRFSDQKKQLWLPLLPLALGSAFFLTDYIDTNLIRVNGSRVLSFAEVFTLMMVGFLEGCIEIGVIPCNRGYDQFFSGAVFPAVIQNGHGRIFFRTAAPWPYAEAELPDSADSVRLLPGGIRLRRMAVTGGSFIYGEDLSALEKLKEDLRRETELWEARNAILAKENDLKEEKARLETKAALYDRISRELQPRMLRMLDMFAGAEQAQEEDFRRVLSASCLLNAYLKRRGNMELIAAEHDGKLPFTELAACMAESLEYAKLGNVETVMLPLRGGGELLLEDAAALYELFENLLEEMPGSVRFLTVSLSCSKGDIGLRLMITPAEEKWDVLLQILKEESSLRFSAEREGTDGLLRISRGGKGI